MALKNSDRKLTNAELRDPQTHQFWLVGGKLFRRFNGDTAEMKVGALIPFTLRANVKGALQARTVTDSHAFVALRLKKSVRRSDGIQINAGTVVVLYRGIRYKYKGQPPADTSAGTTNPVVMAQQRKVRKAWLYDQAAPLGTN